MLLFLSGDHSVVQLHILSGNSTDFVAADLYHLAVIYTAPHICLLQPDSVILCSNSVHVQPFVLRHMHAALVCICLVNDVSMFMLQTGPVPMVYILV